MRRTTKYLVVDSIVAGIALGVVIMGQLLILYIIAHFIIKYW